MIRGFSLDVGFVVSADLGLGLDSTGFGFELLFSVWASAPGGCVGLSKKLNPHFTAAFLQDWWGNDKEEKWEEEEWVSHWILNSTRHEGAPETRRHIDSSSDEPNALDSCTCRPRRLEPLGCSRLQPPFH